MHNEMDLQDETSNQSPGDLQDLCTSKERKLNFDQIEHVSS
jgi:hypothetical protein